jgi:hypothetical protein
MLANKLVLLLCAYFSRAGQARESCHSSTIVPPLPRFRLQSLKPDRPYQNRLFSSGGGDFCRQGRGGEGIKACKHSCLFVCLFVCLFSCVLANKHVCLLLCPLLRTESLGPLPLQPAISELTAACNPLKPAPVARDAKAGKWAESLPCRKTLATAFV